MLSREGAAVQKHGRLPLAGRLWRRVMFDDGCWEWTGHRTPKGYGEIGLGSRSAGVGLAHRLSHELMKGPIPDDLCVLHSCDNPPCVRPEHLFLGTKADNNRDMDAKGRRRTKPCPGETNVNAVVSDADAETIRELYARGGLTQKQIGERFGITQSAVSLIVLGCHYAASGGPIAKKKQGGSQLTQEQIDSLRATYSSGAVTKKRAAEIHGIPYANAWMILSGKTWRNQHVVQEQGPTDQP